MRPFLSFNFVQRFFALNVLALFLAIGGGFLQGDLSRSRQIVFIALSLVAAAQAGAIYLFRTEDRAYSFSQRILEIHWLKPALAVFFVAFWALTCLPPEKSGSFMYYYIGLQPFFFSAAVFFGSALLFIFAGRQRLFARLPGKPAQLAVAGIFIVLLLSCIVAAWFRAQGQSESYFYGAGVPLLAWQVFAALVLYVILESVPAIPSIAYFFLIWGGAAWLWASAPVQDGFFVGRLLLPNMEHYPFADLEKFDIGSQFALIGQGINNNVFFDRALYMAFLVYLHTWFGQNYEQLMIVQAALFAIFPAQVFLIGEKLHSRTAGAALGVLIALRGLNGLEAMGWINTATPKHMLTDFPTAIVLAATVLSLFHWIQSPAQNWRSVMWAAGWLSLGSMLRPHLLVFFFLLAILIIWEYRSQWRAGLVVLGLAFMAFLIPLTPWGVGNGSGKTIVDLFWLRLENLIEDRYQSEEGLNPVYYGYKQASLALPAVDIPAPVSHFFNNTLGSFLFMPTSAEFLSIRDVTWNETGYWKGNYSSLYSVPGWAAITINLLLFSLGYACSKRKLGGLLVVIFFFYIGMNSLARTSGGRYLVPVDWVVVVGYWLGCVSVYRLVFSKDAESTLPDRNPPGALLFKSRQAIGKTLGVLTSLGLLGALIPSAGYLHPLRYPPLKGYELLGKLPASSPISKPQANAFLKQPGAVILRGRALYPRFLYQGMTMGLRSKVYGPLKYDRTFFRLIGSHGSVYVILPGQPPANFPNASDDVFVLGCQTQYEPGIRTVDAVMVVLPGEQQALLREPQAPLACPLPDPVCDNNGLCH